MRFSSDTYIKYIQTCDAAIQKLRKQARLLSWARTLGLFLSISLYWLYFTANFDHPAALILASALLICFVIAVKVHAETKEKLSFQKLLRKGFEEEVAYLEDYKLYNSAGARFADADHAYSTDMDLFVEGGFFQHLNRCSGVSAEEALANFLLKSDKTHLTQRQQAVEELSKAHLWRHEYRAEGLLRPEEDRSRNRLKNWISKESTRDSFKKEKIFVSLMSIAAFATLVSAILGIGTWNLFLIVFIFNLVWVGRSGTFIGKEHRMLGKTIGELKRYSLLIKRYADQDWDSQLLRAYQQQLSTPADSSKALQTLNKLLERFDYIHNIFVSPILNGMLLFHLYTYYMVMEWKRDHGQHLIGWLEALDQIEALSSLANFRANNPTFAYPRIVEDKGIFEATHLGHPMLNHQSRVCNDITMKAQNLVVLTGSNMAGKSTFLRTLGVNMILAKAGAPVCASELVMSDFQLYTCIKVKDSLQQNESYFYAELKRLKALKDKISHSDDYFVLLDEILRGTNSGDKLKGSIALMTQLAEKGTFGVLATHDLGVSQLAENYKEVNCLHFASQLHDGDLKFDYKLKPGVCQQLNATYLMTMMGIIEAPEM